MQLTPRNLVLACGAVLAGGTVFGVITTLAPPVTLTPATATTPPAASTAPSTTDTRGLGDEEISYPASPALSMSAWPTPVATRPVGLTPSPGALPNSSPAPSASASPATKARLSSDPTTTSSATSTREPVRAGSGPAPGATRAPRPRATPTRAATTARRPAAAPRRTSTLGEWRAPDLQVGANTIALPRLTSGATVRVTVGCSPSSACQVTGDQLVIDPAATAVTVTWWAPARNGYRAWQVSRGL